MEKNMEGLVEQRRGRPFCLKGKRNTEFRISVNIPGDREGQLRRVAERHGLPLAAFMRQSVLLRLDALENDEAPVRGETPGR